MNKFLILSASAFVLTAFPAMAEDAAPTGELPAAEKHEGGHKGRKGMPMFEKMDTNKDGNISKGEFLAIHEQRFAEMDANKDGNISKEEAEAGKKAWREKMEQRRADMKKRKEEAGKDAAKPEAGATETAPAPQ